MVQSTTTSANPGNIVVPLSAIIDQLQGKLSSADINALLYAIVAKKKSEVRPGDLITAELVNQILHDLEDLQLRVAQLETATPAPAPAPQPGAIITSVSPSTVHEGDRLTVNGNNFNVPTINNQVSLDQTPVTSGFGLGGSAQQFGFDIPNMGVPAGGKTVTLKVSNGFGSPGSINFLLLPQVVVPKGRVDVAYSQAPVILADTTIALGGSYIFGFTVTAKADLTGQYSVTSTAGGWATELLQDAVDAVRASNSFTIAGNPAGTDQKVRIRVTVPAGASPADVKTLTVNVLETTPGTQVLPGSISTTLAIGQLPPTPETRVRISLSGQSGDTTLDGLKVRFNRSGNPATAVGFIQLRATFTEAGSYELLASLSNPNGWNLIAVPTPLPVPAGAFPRNVPITVQLTANAGAAATDFIFQIVRGTDIRVQYRLSLTVV